MSMNITNRSLVSSTSIAAVALASLSTMLLTGCASTPSSTDTADNEAAQYEESAIIHQVTAADRALAKSTTPIAGDSAVLWVNGLGCPQCASNIDLQLERVKGVEAIYTDLSTGKVSLAFKPGQTAPSPAQLTEAIEDSGFTLVKVKPGALSTAPSPSR
jgi:copper chaperone CopZ